MHITLGIIGILFCLGAVLDAFQTIILPRRPTGRLRITTAYFRVTWTPWKAFAQHFASADPRNKSREQVLSAFGPSSLLLLLGIWGFLLITGFALIFFALHTPFHDPILAANPTRLARIRTDLYVSGTTLFTLGLGDVLPTSLTPRALLVVESGAGLGFVALVIGYVPVLYNTFSRREIAVALLDGRAGSPPTSAELLRRHSFAGGQAELAVLLAEWERWSAEILETHVSYPVLCYFRSQHDNQSWLSALTAVLDTCALLISIVPGEASRQAQLTFAIARHALVDLNHVFHLEAREAEIRTQPPTRLLPDHFNNLCGFMTQAGLRLCGDESAGARLHALRALYEPPAQALAEYLCMPLPTWTPDPKARDQWKIVEEVRSQAAAALNSSALTERASALHREDH